MNSIFTGESLDEYIKFAVQDNPLLSGKYSEADKLPAGYVSSSKQNRKCTFFVTVLGNNTEENCRRLIQLCVGLTRAVYVRAYLGRFDYCTTDVMFLLFKFTIRTEHSIVDNLIRQACNVDKLYSGKNFPNEVLVYNFCRHMDNVKDHMFQNPMPIRPMKRTQTKEDIQASLSNTTPFTMTSVMTGDNYTSSSNEKNIQANEFCDAETQTSMICGRPLQCSQMCYQSSGFLPVDAVHPMEVMQPGDQEAVLPPISPEECLTASQQPEQPVPETQLVLETQQVPVSVPVESAPAESALVNEPSHMSDNLCPVQESFSFAPED